MASIQKIGPCLWFDGQEFSALNGGLHFKRLDLVALQKAYDA